MESGGDVLWAIAALTFVMWTLAIERVWYYKFGLSKDVGNAINTWEARSERNSWNAKQIREKLISEVSSGIISVKLFEYI